ncbi:MAG: MmgE/PrpD family protein [Terracoccus sp.]
MTLDTGHARRLEHLVEWGLGDEVLLDEDVPHVVTLVTDTIAAIVGASREPEVLALATAAQGLGGVGPATVLCTGEGTTPVTAALVNGNAAVRLELDEGNPHAANHPCAHTVPALLATAEAIGSDGPTLLAATAAAYEVAVRVARGARLRRSVHPFGTTMVCGGALGVARLRGLDVEQATRAVRLAAALVPASTQRAANTGATIRNAITGVCASIGVLAVELALAGTGDDAFALPTVFGEVLGEGYDDSRLDAELGDLRLIRSGYLKTHASSRWTHAPIEATETLLNRHGFGAHDVAAVEVATYDPATRLDGREARNGFAGKHSIPYCVAARIVLRHNGVSAYTDDAAAEPRLRTLMHCVSVVEDPAMTAATPGVRAARVTVRLLDGRELSATETAPAGGCDNPYPADVIHDKHRSLTRRALRDDAADELLGWCAELPSARDLNGLAAIVGRRR